jgi:hypothetical protein
LLTYKDKKIRHPKALVDYFYEKVNYKSAFLIVLIALMLELFFLFVVLKTPQAGIITLYLVYSRVVVGWFVLGLIIYLLAYLIKSKKKMPKKALEKILSGLASFRVVVILFYILFGLIGFIFLGNYIQVLQNVVQNPELLYSTTAFPALTTANTIGVVILGITSLLFFIYFLRILYYFIKKIFETKSVITTIFYMLVLFVLSSVITLIFGV